jgi:hypothetical protein
LRGAAKGWGEAGKALQVEVRAVEAGWGQVVAVKRKEEVGSEEVGWGWVAAVIGFEKASWG